jgi:hypothetical protein
LLAALLAAGVTAMPARAADATTTAACPAVPVQTAGPGPAMEVIAGEIHLATPTATDSDASFHLSTTTVHRGGAPVDVSVVDTRTPDPDTVVTIRKEVVETAQRVTAGVEQSWCFDQLPRGRGDLVVRVTTYAEAKGGNVVPTYPGVDVADGNSTEGIPLHYPDLLEAQYHHGTWVDSAGRRSPVTARFVDYAVELTVPANVLAGTTFPATLDPIIIVTPPQIRVAD